MVDKFLKTTLILAIYLSSASTDISAKTTYAFIKSKNFKQIDMVIKGFTESYPNAKISILDMNGKKVENKVSGFIQKEKPSIIICMGSLAARTAIKIEKKIPIIFSMVINYKKVSAYQQDNVTGISMEIPPANLFTQFKMLMPEVRTIGVPFHPAVSSEIVNDAYDILKEMGLQLIRIRVSNPINFASKLSKNAENCSGLWMLADTKLYNRKTKAIKELVKFSKIKKVPLLAFSEAFVKSGAFFSISINYKSLGSQITMISKRLIQNRVLPANIPIAPPIGTFTVINRDYMQLLIGDDFDESIYDEVDKVYPEEN